MTAGDDRTVRVFRFPLRNYRGRRPGLRRRRRLLPAPGSLFTVPRWRLPWRESVGGMCGRCLS